MREEVKCTLKEIAETIFLAILIWSLVYILMTLKHTNERQQEISKKIEYIYESLHEFDLECVE